MTRDAAARLQSLDRFAVRQRITPMVNRYEIREYRPDGALGDILALAQQKRIALKEQVTFFADEARTVPVFGFRSRAVLDVSGVTDVVDAEGRTLGTFRKDFAASLLRSTWHLEQAGLPVITGRERNILVALVRRFALEFLPYHFDFTRPDGTVTMSVDKKFAFGRDSYRVEIHDPALDRRMAAAMAVALDALQAR
jgi:uncharacterized protein YxjI